MNYNIIKFSFLFFCFGILFSPILVAQQLNVGVNEQYQTIKDALLGANGGETIILSDAEHYEESVIENLNFSSEVTIQSANGQRSVIKGIKEFNLSWQIHEGNIYKASISEDVWQLFKDREQQVPARWPNANFNDNSVFDYTNWATPNNNNGPDGSIIDNGLSSAPFAGKSIDNASAVLTYGSWVSWHLPVHTFAGNTITVDANPLRFRSKQHYYFLEGSVDFIDVEGEWAYDKDTQTIYVFANSLADLQNTVFEGKTQTYALEFSNCSNIRMEGIEFLGTTFKASDVTDFTVYDCEFNYPNTSKRMIGVYNAPEPTLIDNTNSMGSANNILIEKCLFQNTDGRALWLYGNNIKIYDNLFRYIDWSTANNTLSAALDGRTSINNEYKNNTIHTTGAMTSISPGQTYKATYNQIYNFGLLQSDGAGIHCTRTEVADSEIAYNWIYLSAQGHYDHRAIRFDAPVSEPELAGTNGKIHHNVTWDAGSTFLKGNDHLCFNNTVLESTYNQNGIAILREENSNVDTEVINNLASTMGPHRNQSDAQSNYNMPVATSNNWDGYSNPGVTARSLIASFENQDFTPTSSAVIDQGTYFTDFVSDHPVIGSAPDIGAYEAGGVYWVPGITWEPNDESSFPITLSLTKPSIQEGKPANNYVSFIETTSNENLTYSLPSNTLDNQYFKIGTTYADRLYANNTVFDFSVQNSYAITIEARNNSGDLVGTEDFTIDILPLESLSLTKPNILEGIGANNYVSFIETTSTEILTYSLPLNTLDNQYFKIGTTYADRLYANNMVFDYSTQSSYNIRIEARNSMGDLVTAENFIIDILSAVALSLTKPNILEGIAANHYISSIESTSNESLTYSLPLNTLENQYFQIGTTYTDRLYANNTVFDYATQSSYDIILEGRNSSGDLVVAENFTIEILNGSSSKSANSKIDFIENGNILENSVIYPNPAENKITISLQNDLPQSIRVFSIDGKLVKNVVLDKGYGNKSGVLDINIEALTPGNIYVLELINKDGSSEYHKLVKK